MYFVLHHTCAILRPYVALYIISRTLSTIVASRIGEPVLTRNIL